MAISIDNRRTLIYSTEQTMDIGCEFTNGSRLGPSQYVIESINEIVLPRNADCAVITLRHQWRADAYPEFEAKPRVLPVPLDLKKVPGTAIIGFKDRVKQLKLNQFKPVSFKEVDDELNKLVSIYTRAWMKWLILAIGAIVIIGGLVLFAYFYCGRRQASFLSPIFDRVETGLGTGQISTPLIRQHPIPPVPVEIASFRPNVYRDLRASSEDNEERVSFVMGPAGEGGLSETRAIRFRPYVTKEDLQLLQNTLRTSRTTCS